MEKKIDNIVEDYLKVICNETRIPSEDRNTIKRYADYLKESVLPGRHKSDLNEEEFYKMIDNNLSECTDYKIFKRSYMINNFLQN